MWAEFIFSESSSDCFAHHFSTVRREVSVGLICFPGVGTQKGRAAFARLTYLSFLCFTREDFTLLPQTVLYCQGPLADRVRFSATPPPPPPFSKTGLHLVLILLIRHNLESETCKEKRGFINYFHLCQRHLACIRAANSCAGF